MSENIKDSLQTFFSNIANGLTTFPSTAKYYAHTHPQQVSIGMVLVSTVGLALLYVEHSDKEPVPESKEEQEQEPKEEPEPEPKEEQEPEPKEISPMRGGSRRRRNKAKKTKRRHS
jgi:hypothetical protein